MNPTPPKSNDGGAVRVLVIAGYGRSGSTLLDRLLGEVPGVCSLGEIRHLWQEGLIENRRCGCGAPFADCEHWDQVLRQAFGSEGPDGTRMRELQRKVDRWWKVPLLARRTADPDLQRYAGALGDLYTAVAGITGSRLLVDSSKDVSHAYVLGHVPGVEVRVLHLVRDPRAVASSWQRLKHNPGSGRAMDQWAPWLTALRWDMVNTLAGAISRTGRPYRTLRYEDLVSDPAGSLRQILAFAGEEDPQIPIDAEGRVVLSATHTAAGNPDRFRSGPTLVHADDRWRREMDARSGAVVTAICSPGLRRWGYPLRGWRLPPQQPPATTPPRPVPDARGVTPAG